MKKRRIFEELLKQKNSKKISLVLGARQVGKTTVLKALHEYICENLKNKGLFLDLDIFSNFEKVSSFEDLINTLRLHGYQENQKQFFYLFLDEFQRYEVISILMKNVYDNFNNIKIYASGSSSLKIKAQIQESLAGRKKINLLYPLDFEEFLWFKEENNAFNQLTNINHLKGKDLSKPISKLIELLNEFLIFGGYPEVVLQKTKNDKIEVLESIFDLYVKKDLIEYLRIEKVFSVKKLIEYLAVNNGQKTKYDEISQICSLDYQSVKNYIEILKETHLIMILKPFFTNKNKELVKIPKIYFIDNGVRNFFINNFNPVNLRADKGFLFEGYVIAELLKAGIKSEFLKFWQDKNKREVDIILDFVHKQVPIEVKFKTNLKKDDFLSLKAFLNTYPEVKKVHLINLNSQRQINNIYTKLPFKLEYFKTLAK
ncbi:MAG: ATP-binding protein [Nanoarchaeota archaeon]|nr:ATP-binding protein [Nanoarchaeota archaeon]